MRTAIVCAVLLVMGVALVVYEVSMNSIPGILLAIVVSGLLGGLVNAVIAQEGFVLPLMRNLPDGGRIWRVGFMGNAIVGAATAVVLAGMQSELGAVVVLRSAGGEIGSAAPYTLNIHSLVGALVAGIGGARLLTAEVDLALQKLATRNLSGTLAQVTDQ
jgi:hypothetical protein